MKDKINMLGNEIIKYIAKTLPSKPGVYQMESSKGEILYIGKAKNLAKRVINYTSINNLTRRLQRMVSLTKKMNFIVTNTEIEALLLECNLIKQRKPRFNIILRDDKSFPYVLINNEHEIPRIHKYRGSKRYKGNYFGPFVSPSIADFTLISLQKAFLLRSCSDSIFSNRKRPCLLYDIKRCSAPCVGYISKDKYYESISDAKKFLSGNTKKIENKLKQMMNIASKNEMFEEAARLRDRIKSIYQIQKYQSVYIKDMRNIDIFAIKVLHGKSCIYGMFYRNGSNYGNKSFFPTHDENATEAEILESFLFQFYVQKESPAKILINLDARLFKNVQTLLNQKNRKKINIIQPRVGEKLKHIKLAEKNASQNIKLKKASLESHQKALENLKKFLLLDKIPNRIEVFDNSHTFGNESVGVMIVVDQEGFSPKHYRKFNIRYDKTNSKKSFVDDYYMIKEVLSRRFNNITDNKEVILPDLLIIDGGKGQLNTANQVIKKYNLTSIALISISKGVNRNSGREIIHTLEKNRILKPNDPLLFFLERIRDEAHRFAITAHRKRRGKQAIKSVFADINGIGVKRKKALLEYFGTIKSMKKASKHELQKANGITKKIAEDIYNFFNR